MHVTESFDIRSAAAMLGVPGTTARKPFNAQSVHMDVGLPAMNYFNLGMGGSNIMVTGQLSGCAFVMRAGAAGGTVDVAHVQPQGVTPAALATAVATANPGVQVYGASGEAGNYDAADRSVSIIGIRNPGGWSIYAQKQDRDAGDYRIKSVYQIWPARRKVYG